MNLNATQLSPTGGISKSILFKNLLLITVFFSMLLSSKLFAQTSDNSVEKPPTISGTYCAPMAPGSTSLSLTGTGVAGSTIKLYNDGTDNTTAPANAVALVSSPTNVIVTSNGTWAATVTGIDASFNIKAVAISPSPDPTQSDYSNKAVINPQPTPKTVNFSSNAICSGGTVTATILSSELNVVYQIFNYNDPTGNPVVGTGGNISLITGTLTADASLRVKASYGTAACDIFMPVTPYEVSVTSISPKTINYSSNAICSGGTITATVVNSEANVIYQLFNNFVATGNKVVGTGGDITLTTDPLTADANLNVKATKTGTLTCETYLSGTWFAVTLTVPQSNEGLTINSPILSTDGKVSGTFLRDGANIKVFIDGNLLGTTTVTDGKWILSGLSPTRLYNGGKITASVQEGTNCESKQVDGPIVGDTTLPVELLYFSGTQTNGKVNLVWATALERNNSHFEIQKSTNGIQFKSIGKVTGAGNSLSVKKYAFTDKEAGTGTAYYRLKQVDFDHGYEYSKIVAINSTGKAGSQEILAYPNPTKNKVSVIIKSGVSENYALEVRDLVGKVVMVKEVAYNNQNSEATLDIQHLPAGTYLITARLKNHQLVTRIVKN